MTTRTRRASRPASQGPTEFALSDLSETISRDGHGGPGWDGVTWWLYKGVHESYVNPNSNLAWCGMNPGEIPSHENAVALAVVAPSSDGKDAKRVQESSSHLKEGGS